MSKATLSRWEAGKSRPYAPELAQVLEALNVPEASRRQCFQNLGVARGERFLCDEEPEAMVLPVSGGELLKALRVRSKVTQADAARAVGVTQPLLSHWENNGCWPDSDQLHLLCRALGATMSELQGLSTRAWQGHTELPLDRDGLFQALHILEHQPHHYDFDLHYLALGSRFHRLYRENHIDETEALTIWGHFGNYLSWHRRFQDATRVAMPVLEGARKSNRPLTGGQVMAASAVTDAIAVQSSPLKAMEILRGLGDRIPVAHRAWWYCELAQKASLAGWEEGCCHYWEQALAATPIPAQADLLRLLFGEQLCRYGRFRDALSQAQRCQMPLDGEIARIRHELVTGVALGMLGHGTEGRSLVNSARQKLQQSPHPGLQKFAYEVEQRLPY